LVPLAWLLHRRSKDAALWWLAAAFGVSFLADLAAHWIAPLPTISVAYPVLQCGLVGAVLLNRAEAEWFVLTLAVVGIAAVGIHRAGLDVFLHTVAWLGVAGIVIDRPALGAIRGSLLVTFGLGWIAWLGFVAHPTLAVWDCTRCVGSSGRRCFATPLRVTDPC